MGDHWKTKVRRDALGNVLPRCSAVIASVEAPVILQVEPLRASRRPRNLVDALAELGMLVGEEIGANPLVRSAPAAPSITRLVDATGANGDQDIGRSLSAEHDGVQAEPTPTGLPAGAVRMIEETLHQGPRFSGVARLEEGARLHAAIEDS